MEVISVKIVLFVFCLLVFLIVIVLYCCLRVGKAADEHMEDLEDKIGMLEKTD